MSDLSNGIRINAIRYIVVKEAGWKVGIFAVTFTISTRNRTETEIFVEPSTMSLHLFTYLYESIQKNRDSKISNTILYDSEDFSFSLVDYDNIYETKSWNPGGYR